MNATPCSVPDCQNPARTRGLCNGHYKRLRKLGDPLAGGPVAAGPAVMKCSVGDCDDSVLSRGWCNKHYSAWKKHGDPLYHDQRRSAAPPPCAVDGCGRPSRNAGLCAGHYTRQRTLGDVLADRPIRTYGTEATQKCTVAGCQNNRHAKGLCATHSSQNRRIELAGLRCSIGGCDRTQVVTGLGMCGPHYDRWREFDDPDAGPTLRKHRSANRTPSANSPEYRANHRNVRAVRGAAWLHICTHCGAQAREWAQTHGTSGERPSDFSPLCKPCHARYDGARYPVMMGEAHPQAKLTEAAVRDIRSRRRYYGLFLELASKYGVTTASIANAAHYRTWKHVA